MDVDFNRLESMGSRLRGDDGVESPRIPVPRQFYACCAATAAAAGDGFAPHSA